MTGRVMTCTYHCSSCGLCFHSLNAFDAHRVGDFGSDDPETGRRCLHPLDLDGRLVALGVGECRVYAEVKRGRTIWTHGGDLARMRRRVALGASDGRETDALGVAA